MKRITFTILNKDGTEKTTAVCTTNDPIGRSLEPYLTRYQEYIPCFIGKLNVKIEKVEDIDEVVK